MATLFERDQSGKYESWEEIVANVEAEQTPLCSMIPKGMKPVDVIDNWQAEAYPDVGLGGVPDGKDAQNFESTNRKRLQGVIQKVWHNPAVSDLATEMKVHGISNELSHQVAISMKMLKRKMESRVGSDMDCRPEDDGINGYETRGVGSWLSTSAQGNLPVPTEFRPSADAVKENVALSTITEAQFREMLSSAFKVTNGSNHLQGFVGIDMKNQIDNWTSYQDDVTGKIPVRSLNDKASLRQLIQVVERIQLSGGTVDLHPTNWLFRNADGSASDATYKSGVFLQMDMWKLSYVRKPRVVKLDYKGGGEKRIVDAIYMLKCLNPLGQLMAKCTS